MRLGIDGLPSRYPLIEAVPALMQDDDMTQRWLAGLDEVLAPALHVLDSLDAYFDPLVTPLDFLAWLAGWVGAGVSEELDEPTARVLIANMAQLYGMRGTVEGLRHYLDLSAPARVLDVSDGCGVSVSRDPNAAIEGAGTVATLTIRLRGNDDAVARTTEMIAAWCPAHVPFVVERDTR